MTSLDINMLYQEQVSRSAEGFKCSMLLFVFPLKAHSFHFRILT